ncbi:MAG: ArnT family glycosyltransferase, partial [Anaerolineales bacterium]
MADKSLFGQSKIILWGVLIILFVLGFAIRMVDLTDPPLDFHPTRQLRSAIIARSLYYRSLPETDDWHRQVAVSQYTGEGIIEPLVMETIVATTYRVIGSDPVWVARIYSSLFWVIGGLGIYFLTSAMTSPDGGVLATAYYLFIPFGIIASRSFQPDPLMVMLIVFALWAVYYWYRKPSWKTAILAGVLAGLAMFVKAVALFPILFAFAAFFLVSKGFKNAIKDPQIWLIAGLSILPMIAYTVYGVYIMGSMESQFLGRFFPEMWRDLGFYFQWEDMATGIVGYGPVFLA